MAIFKLTKTTTVATLKEEFFTAFGAKLRIYSGRSQADESATLGELGLTNEGDFECRASLTVGSFIERMQSDYGLKVKVYTCDDWVAVLDGLTLESAGKVKKNAVKADMESMIAYQRTDEEVEPVVVEAIKKSATYGDYTINIAPNNSVTVLKGGVACDNAKGALREVAALVGFEVDAAWTTQQLGGKLVDAIKNGVSTASKAEAEKAAAEAKAKAEAEKAAAEKAKAEAEAAKAAEEAKRVAEEAKARAAAEVAAAQAEAERMRAELEAAQKAKAEAEAAKAEVERMKAEAEKMRLEAERAKEAAAKAAAEAAKVQSAPVAAKTDGELPGRFTINDKGDKICFSRGLLQFNPAKYEFRFAVSQYNIIGKDNEKIAPNYDGWIDLFGWGTSGFMGCQPTEASKNTSDYGPASGDIAGTNYDWGVYNPITNGGNKEGLWRTPTNNEWDYLMNNRSNAAKLRVWCTVCGVEGYMLMPDDFWNNRLRMPLDITANICSVNKYTAEQWSQLEALGVVFMPRAGSRYQKTFSAGSCSVWLATYHGSGYARYGNVGETGYNITPNGLGVRLIKDVK